MKSCFIANEHLRAEFVSRGAELRRLAVLHGPELLWGGNPSHWGRFSPVLFPLVGRLKGDTLRHQGRAYPMGQHGFARDLDFRLVRLSRECCTWAVSDDAATRSWFPFPFELRLTYRLEGMALKVEYELRNPGSGVLPASLGAHPAFRWPLPGGHRDEHRIEFAQMEPAPVRRLLEGLLDPHPHPSPVDGSLLKLRDQLFQADALIFDQIQSRSLRYSAPGSLGLEISWEGFSQLGLWSKPGAGFLCIEPWAGFASPADFDGEFIDKPGLMHLAPGEQRLFSWTARLLPRS